MDSVFHLSREEELTGELVLNNVKSEERAG